MARRRDQIFAGFGAGLFLITSSALTVIVIFTMVQENNAKKDTTKASSSIAASTKTTQTGAKMQDFTPTSTSQAKLDIVDIIVGTGDTVKPGDTITADYVGALMKDGSVFDSSASQGGPATFPLTGVIQGWSLGLPGMKVGGTRRLLIPADLAYANSSPTAAIPAYSDLVFDVTLVKIN